MSLGARAFALVALLASLGPSGGTAQNRWRRAQYRPSVYALLGVTSSLQNLNDSGTASLGGGVSVAGGLNAPLGVNLAGLSLGLDLAWGQLTLHRAGAGSGTRVSSLSYGAHVAVIWLNGDRITSDAFIGGGGVSIHPSDGSGASSTRPFIRAGVDLDYAVSTKLLVVVQASTLAYRIANFPAGSVLADYAHGQSHFGLSGGIALRL